MNATRLLDQVPSDVRAIGHRLREGGNASFLVGGCVRDILSNRDPRDWDIATSATPAFLQAHFHRVERLGSRWETFLVFAGPESPPRQVSLLRGAAIEADLRRRDFTINAIALPFPPRGDETFLDPVGGRSDLAAGLLRGVENPDERFSEDPLRPLRAVRLEAELNFSLEPATLVAMSRWGADVAQAAPERVRDELLRILACPKPSRGIERMRETGMLRALLGEIADTAGVGQNRHHRLDVYQHSLAALDFVSESVEAGPPLRFAVLFHDVAKPMTRTIRRGEPSFIGHETVGARVAELRARALRLPEAEVHRIRDLVRHHLVRYTDRWSDRAVRRFIRRVGPQRIADLLLLYAADLRAKDPDRFGGTPLPEEVAALSVRLDAVRAAGAVFSIRDLAITGEDVMRALEIPPGPRVGRTLAALLERVISDPAENSRDRLLAALREMNHRAGDESC